MPIRITGMNSGLDTESIISELMKAQQTKVDNVKKQQTKLQWKQDAWKTLNTKVYSFFNTTLSNMRFATDYSKKTTDVSNSSYVSVVTGNSAMNSTQKMTIDQLAAPGYLTGGKLDGSYTKSSKLTDLGIEVGSSFSVSTNGKTTNIEVTEGMTISGLVTKLQNAGVDANFDEKNQRFYISSKKSGADNDFTITASNTAGVDALTKLKLLSGDELKSEYEKYANMTEEEKQAAIETEVAKRLASYLSQQTSLTKSISDQEAAIEALKESYSGMYEGESIDSISSSDLEDQISAIKARIEEIGEPEEGSADAEELQEKMAELAALQTKKDYVDGYENAKTKLASTQASLDTVNSYITDGGDSGKIRTEVTADIEAEIQAAKDALDSGITDSGIVRITGKDAKISLNGVEYTSTSNVFEINGLTITVTGGEGEEVILTTRQDTDGIYDMIKNFIKEYNSLINEMDALYNADSIKGYEPLTDDEKDEMSDSEVEAWETKIKDSILRGDSNLSSVASSLKNIMLAGTEVNGTKMYLSSFGISTLGYFSSAENERNAYHIDGDSDDSSTGTNEDKLKAAIAADPDSVITFFSQLSQNLYSNLNSLTARTDLRSFGSIYDDKKMQEDYNNYTTKISDLEDKLQAMEDRYYNQFAAMETALAKLQSNQSAVTSLLGG